MSFRTAVPILSLLCAAALGCGPAADLAGDAAGMGDVKVVELTGPFPASVEGELEIADIQDAGGDDYLMSGSITTGQGIVFVQSLGAVLEAGGAEEDGRVRATVKPSDIVPDSYDIVAIQRVP